MRSAPAGLLAMVVATGHLGLPREARAEDEAHVAEATNEQKEAAQKQFVEGMRLYEDESFEQALVAFRASYDVVKSPNSHLMIADTLQELGRTAEAYATYEQTAEEAEQAAELDEKYAPTAQAARDALETLRPEVGMVSVRVVSAPKGATLKVAGRPIDHERWTAPIAAPPGQVDVRLELDGDHASTKTVEVEAGGTSAVEIELGEPEPEPLAEEPDEDEARPWRPQRRTGAYVAGGVGAAGLVTFAALTVADTADEVAIGGLVVGLLGVGTGAVLWFTSGTPPEDEAATEQARRPAPRVGVWVGPRGGAVVGEF